MPTSDKRPSLRALWLFLSVLATGCSRQLLLPLPTLLPAASVPQARPLVALPATFTPIPRSPLPTVTATPGVPPVEPAMTTTTLASAPTPLGQAEDSRSRQVSYRASPPGKIDCNGGGLLYRGEFPSPIGGPWRSFHAYLPPCYGHDGRVYPVLYLFHGSIQTDSQWADLGLVEAIDTGIRDGRYPLFISIMPYNGQIGNMTSGGDGSIEAITLNALIPFTDSAFCTWAVAGGRSLGGISRGGYWALMIAFRHTESFTAVSGHSSHLRLETDAAAYNPLATYAQADLSNMRIWLDWGEGDFLRHGQERLHRSLSEIGVAHVATVNEGGHSEAYWATHLREYLDWHAAGWPRERSHYPECLR